MWKVSQRPDKSWNVIGALSGELPSLPDRGVVRLVCGSKRQAEAVRTSLMANTQAIAIVMQADGSRVYGAARTAPEIPQPQEPLKA